MLNKTYRSINFTSLPAGAEVEGVCQVLGLAPCQPGCLLVLAGQNGQELEAVAGAPDGEGVSSLHCLGRAGGEVWSVGRYLSGQLEEYPAHCCVPSTSCEGGGATREEETIEMAK